MTITLRKCISETNRVDKVFVDDADKEYTGYLREAADPGGGLNGIF